MEVLTSDTESTSGESTLDSNSISKKLLTCEVCSINEAKYTCPRCEVRTCCLKCSTIHKNELHCSGMRDSTKFIPIHKFTNIDFASDYKFLEQITKNVASYKKGVGHYQHNERKFLPRRFMMIQKVAERHKICLKFLPNNFVRHKQNSTHYNKEGDKLMWLVEWIFVMGDNFKLQEKNVPEDIKLGEILQKYFTKQDDSPLVQEKLQYYQSAGLGRVKLFLKAEQIAGNKYYELDLDENLKVNLTDKVIIEYPVIHVVLLEHSNCYQLVEDGDKEISTQDGINVVNEIIMKAESDESIYKSMKNLLFVSDISDNEVEGEDVDDYDR